MRTYLFLMLSVVSIITYSQNVQKIIKKTGFPVVQFNANKFMSKYETSNMRWDNYVFFRGYVLPNNNIDSILFLDSINNLTNRTFISVFSDNLDSVRWAIYNMAKDYPKVNISYEDALFYCYLVELYINNKYSDKLGESYIKVHLPDIDDYIKVQSDFYKDCSDNNNLEKKWCGTHQFFPYRNMGALGTFNHKPYAKVDNKSFKNGKMFFLDGNVSEMTNKKGLAYGSSWKDTFLSNGMNDIKNAENIKKLKNQIKKYPSNDPNKPSLQVDIFETNYDKPEPWLGFRLVFEVVKK